MKADLYIQGDYWASIDIPGDSLLALLSAGMITRAKQLGRDLKEEFIEIESIACSISLRFKDPHPYTPGADP